MDWVVPIAVALWPRTHPQRDSAAVVRVVIA
jgi:hypothetical protein